LGVRTAHATEQDHNHILDCVTLNYPCPINRLRVVSHNRTKCRENRTVSRIAFYLFCPCRSHHTCESWTETRPHRGLGGPPLAFIALMVGAFGSLLAPPRGPAVDVCHVDGWRSRISIITSQGAHRQCFLTLMVGAPASSAPAPPRGLTIDVS
jgi:hypothetical protein